MSKIDWKNPDDVKAYQRAYRAANKTKHATYQRAYRVANRAKLNTSSTSWRKANPEKVKLSNIQHHKTTHESVRLATKIATLHPNPPLPKEPSDLLLHWPYSEIAARSWMLGYMDGDGHYGIQSTKSNTFLPVIQLLCNNVKSPHMLSIIRNQILAQYVNSNFSKIPIYTQDRNRYNAGADPVDKLYIRRKEHLGPLVRWMEESYNCLLDPAWVFAGLIDAEGTMGLSLPHFSPFIRIGMDSTKRPFLEKWRALLGLGTITLITQSAPKQDGTFGYIASWSIVGKESLEVVMDLLEGKLIPFNKRDQFRIWSHAAKKYVSRRGRWTTEERVEFARLHLQLTATRKGSPPETTFRAG